MRKHVEQELKLMSEHMYMNHKQAQVMLGDLVKELPNEVMLFALDNDNKLQTSVFAGDSIAHFEIGVDLTKGEYVMSSFIEREEGYFLGMGTIKRKTIKTILKHINATIEEADVHFENVTREEEPGFIPDF